MSKLWAIIKKPFLHFKLWCHERKITPAFDPVLSLRIDQIITCLEEENRL
jgi:hypothetical protein